MRPESQGNPQTLPPRGRRASRQGPGAASLLHPAPPNPVQVRLVARDERSPEATGAGPVSLREDTTVLIGIFYSRPQAEKVFGELRRNGFRDDQIAVTHCDLDEPPAGPGRQAAGGGAPLRASLVVALAAAALIGASAAGWLSLVPDAPSGDLGLTALGVTIAGTVVGFVLTKMGSLLPATRAWHARRRRQISRAVVTVWPEDRYDEAADLLCRHAGCPRIPVPNPRSGQPFGHPSA
jgi:CBS domain-containing protein